MRIGVKSEEPSQRGVLTAEGISHKCTAQAPSRGTAQKMWDEEQSLYAG